MPIPSADLASFDPSESLNCGKVFENELVTYDEAKAKCKSYGAKVLEVNSPRENEFFAKQAKSMSSL